MINFLNIDGMRFDALKHIDEQFITEFIKQIESKLTRDFYFFGEYWGTDKEKKNKYLYDTKYHTDLFDVALHYHMAEVSKKSARYDLRKIFANTLVQEHPTIAVTFVDNHDSQPGQALESVVKPWFKKIAYGLILLRKDGYPCIFYGDYYGVAGEYPIAGKKEMINQLIKIRKKYAWGKQTDYLVQNDLIGWVRHGDEKSGGPLAVLITTGNSKTLAMNVGKNQEGKVYIELTGNNSKEIRIDDKGYGQFEVGPGTLTAWVQK